MAHKHAEGAKPGLSDGPELAAHKPSNPGTLLGHDGKDMAAVSGRTNGAGDAPAGGTGMTESHPSFGRGTGN